MSDPISGKVARVLNSRELVINRGRHDGVQVGMRFAVLDSAGQGITDPDTGEQLGSVQRTKVQLEVTQVSERLSVAKTYRQISKNVGGIGPSIGGVAGLFTPPKIVQRAETLKVEDADWEPLSESRSFVKVGDLAVEIAADDYDEVSGIIVDVQDTDRPAIAESAESEEVGSALDNRPDSNPAPSS